MRKLVTLKIKSKKLKINSNVFPEKLPTLIDLELNSRYRVRFCKFLKNGNSRLRVQARFRGNKILEAF